MKVKINQPLEFVVKRDLETIDFLSCEILWKIGIKISHQSVLKKMLEYGCEVDMEKNVIKIPPYLVKEALRKATSPTALYGRASDKTVPLSNDQIHFSTSGYGTYVMDLETGSRRASTLKDIENSAKICDCLETLDVFWPPVSAQDVKPTVRKPYEYYASVCNTTKHIQPDVSEKNDTDMIIKMATKIVGDEKTLRKQPIVSIIVGSSSPLELIPEALDSGFEFASRKLPIVVYSMALMGVSAPANPVATLILANAEILSLVTIFTLTHPGTPLIYCSFASASDPVYGKFSESDPRNVWLNVTSCQLAKHYGLPGFAGGFGNSSKLLDAQTGFQGGLSAIPAILAGANIISGYGFIDSSNTLSYEKLVIDDEYCKLIMESINRYDVDFNVLYPYVQLIEKVGHGRHFLAEKQTSLDFRKLWFSSLFESLTYESWIKKGRKDIVKRAKEKAEEILKTHKPEELPYDIKKDLEDLIDEYDKHAQIK